MGVGRSQWPGIRRILSPSPSRLVAAETASLPCSTNATMARSSAGRLITVAQALWPSTSLIADAVDGFGRIDDWDAGMAAEGEEIGVASDDQIGL